MRWWVGWNVVLSDCHSAAVDEYKNNNRNRLAAADDDDDDDIEHTLHPSTTDNVCEFDCSVANMPRAPHAIPTAIVFHVRHLRLRYSRCQYFL